MKLGLVIPAYNEGRVIRDVLLGMPKKINGVDEVILIVVDDGSSDNTFEESKSTGCITLRHVINLGQGAAFSTGLLASIRLKCDLVVTMDADGQHNAKDIERLIEPILNDRADFVNGSRMFNTKGMPRIRIIGNKIMNVITLLVFQIWSTDSQSGMRAMNKKAIEKIKLYTSGHEVCSEMIGEVKRNHLRMVEVPIETIYTDYSKGKGQNIFNAVNILIKIISMRLAGKK